MVPDRGDPGQLPAAGVSGQTNLAGQLADSGGHHLPAQLQYSSPGLS
jgi:hypothetical protein